MLHHLRELGTVTATAEALHLSVPAVSQQLSVLERDIGMPLVERTGRRLALTPAGERLAAHAQILLANVAAAESEMANLRGAGLGRITITAFATAARTLLPPVWIELAEEQAGPIEVFLTVQEPEAALPALARRDADIAVVHSYTLLPRELPAGCEAHHVAEDPMVLALPPSMAARLGCAPGSPLDLADLADADWVAPAPDSSCMEVMRRACGAAGFVPSVRATAGDFSVLAALVAAGAGVSLIPRLALLGQPAAVSLFAPRQPVSRLISAVSRLGTSDRPDVRAVLASLERAAASLGGGGEPAIGTAPHTVEPSGG